MTELSGISRRLAELTGENAGEAQEILTTSYRNVFSGMASPEEAETVLVDLAKHSGFFEVTPPDFTPDQIVRREGARSLFRRIAMFTNLPPEGLNRLHSAVLQEQAVAQETGIEL